MNDALWLHKREMYQLNLLKIIDSGIDESPTFLTEKPNTFWESQRCKL